MILCKIALYALWFWWLHLYRKVAKGVVVVIFAMVEWLWLVFFFCLVVCLYFFLIKRILKKCLLRVSDIEIVEMEYLPCMCSYRSNFIDNIAANKEKSDNYRKEITSVSGYTETPFSLCGQYFVGVLSCVFSLFIWDRFMLFQKPFQL